VENKEKYKAGAYRHATNDAKGPFDMRREFWEWADWGGKDAPKVDQNYGLGTTTKSNAGTEGMGLRRCDEIKREGGQIGCRRKHRVGRVINKKRDTKTL